MARKKDKEEKLNFTAFFHRGIKSLRRTDGPFAGPGIHSRNSGFNSAFRQYYPGIDPVTTQKTLEAQGAIEVRPAKGGVMLYLPGEKPESVSDKALSTMGLAPSEREGEDQ